MKPRLISVVIPMLNDAETIPETLDALGAQDYSGEWEVVVADNGSTDGGVEMAEGWLRANSRGVVVRAVGRRTAGHARNVGAAHARGDFLAFTDADDAPDLGWLTALAEAAERGDLVAGTVEIDGINDERSRGWHVLPPRERALRADRFLPYASGTNTGVWAEAFERLGGFEEDAISGEDKEFSWRAQVSSFRLVAAPDAVVRYRLRPRVSLLARQHFHYGTTGPRLYRRFRDHGMPPRRPAEALRTWAWILLTCPAAVWSDRFRGRWALEAALACGRLASSMRNRVLYV